MINLSDYPAFHKVHRVAPEVARCPRCGRASPRNEVRSCWFWEADLKQTTKVELQMGCYICPFCPLGRRWFTLRPPAFRTVRQYTVHAQEAVLDLVARFKMSVEGAAQYGRERFHLPGLHATTVLEWFRSAGAMADVGTHQADAVARFSGQMTIDEVYDKGWCQLKATDPLNDVELAYRMLKGSPDKSDIESFLRELKVLGFEPALVTTDGSDLYPSVIEEVWPNAKHQRCVFHFIGNLNDDVRKAFWKEYKTLPKPPKRGRGRPKKRGRPRKDEEKRENRLKVRAARYLLLKRDDHLTDRERERLNTALRICPGLLKLRRFVRAVHELFGPTTTTHELAQARRQAILEDLDFLRTEGLAKALKRLGDDELFEKLTRYLDYDNAEKTSNHVERANREYRKHQKGHYRFRSVRSLCSLLDLLLVRKAPPAEPQRLRRKEPVSDPGDVAGHEIVRAA